MSKSKYIDKEKFERFSDEIFKVANTHGWLDEPRTSEQLLGLVVTEVAEVVEADRNNKRANSDSFFDVLKVQSMSEEGLSEHWYGMWYEEYYKMYVRGSIEEELADVIIRILDMTKELYGNNMVWNGSYPNGCEVYNKDKKAVENAWVFVHDVLNWSTFRICDSISFIYDWAESLGINLDQHIEWKIKYNDLRPYRHGGKKY